MPLPLLGLATGIRVAYWAWEGQIMTDDRKTISMAGMDHYVPRQELG
jgi:hypothetical protein